MAEMTVIGNLAADSQLKTTPSGSNVLNFRVIENKDRKRQDGTYETLKTQGFNVSIWGSLGEMHYERGLKQGDRVKLVGEFWSRDYDKQDGTTGVALDFTAWGIHSFEKARNKPTPQQNAPQQGGGNANTYEPGGWGNPPQGQQGGGGYSQQGYNNPQQQPQQGNGGGWNQPPQQQQNQQPPANDPWSQNANTNGGWGNQ
ncbi:single-stranded DNA-binding protein [Glutamicibacter sp. AOP5-A2-7]